MSVNFRRNLHGLHHTHRRTWAVKPVVKRVVKIINFGLVTPLESVIGNSTLDMLWHVWDIKVVIGCLCHGKLSWWHDVFSHEVCCSVMWCHVTGVLTAKHIVLSFNLMWEDIMLYIYASLNNLHASLNRLMHHWIYLCIIELTYASLNILCMIQLTYASLNILMYHWIYWCIIEYTDA